MKGLYGSPIRVYLCLAAMAVAGIYSGLKLPVSLFPNSSKPLIHVEIPYGSSNAAEFLQNYGKALEGILRSISDNNVEVEQVRSSYEPSVAKYEIEFRWGAPSKTALKETQSAVLSFAARLPSEVRENIDFWTQNREGGFFALSFYSPTRDLDELYRILEPVIVPQILKVQDAMNPGLWNPSAKEVRVELDAVKMASFQILPKDIERAILSAINGFQGGSITVSGQAVTIQMPRQAGAIEDLARVMVASPSGQVVHLGDIAQIDYGPKISDSQIFKTSGAPSLILWASPKAGGNVKRMAEEMLAAVERVMPTMPKDIQYKVLVDPSVFIRSAVNNVFHEVAIGAFLAVVVLFLFIGSLRNTITAAIEIPMSMVLAFILMRASGMNLNLISLGGLALSAGMNVDASVVVMENIFRHFESRKGVLDFHTRLTIIIEAVREVEFAVIASTIASLVVFLPLAFTSELTYAVLGDLAKTVVFSHGFSAIIALVLVPTVRLHLMSRAREDKPVHSPIENLIRRLEAFYGRALGWLISSPKIKASLYVTVATALGLLIAFGVPRLPKELIGRPDTDWMILNVRNPTNSLIRQMETQAEEAEAQLISQFGAEVAYTFTQVRSPNGAMIMARLKDKREMTRVWKAMEAQFVNTPFMKYWVGPWNPSELPIPNPPGLRLAIRGGTDQERAQVTREIQEALESEKAYPRVWTEPDVSRANQVVLKPHLEQWVGGGIPFAPSDLAELSRVVTTGKRIGFMNLQGDSAGIFLRFPEHYLGSPEDLASFPIGLGQKLVPLKALADVQVSTADLSIYREDERELYLVFGKVNEGEDKKAAFHRAEKTVESWKRAHASKFPQVSIGFDEAEKDLNHALEQLMAAVALSIGLIFLTMVLQFGSIMNALLVLVAIPLGLLGVVTSLLIFRSTLSLNSVLGMILLNGIAVANSIILVDFITRLVRQGLDPVDAAIEAGRKRLRPILITSMTTILGMLPIALGLGDGGRILQPLGIAVSGGLWVSMTLTLFIVPALQVAYLQRKARRAQHREFMRELVLKRAARSFTDTLPSESASQQPEYLQ